MYDFWGVVSRLIEGFRRRQVKNGVIRAVE